jgi:hypothetical protein
MIYSLTDNILASIFHYVTDIKDIYTLYCTSKYFREYISNHLFEVHLNIEKRLNLKFLNTITQLKRVYLFRIYLMPLDITQIRHPQLEYIFTNSKKLLTYNEKANVLIYGFTNLKPLEKQKSQRENKNPPREYVEDIKEYFTMRYNMKKGSKIKYKNNDLLSKSI